MDMSIAQDLSADAYSARLVIDLDALADNYRRLAAEAAPAETSAVVKADAYGLGADRVAPVLYSAGCRSFFVAHLQEAANLRPHLPRDATLYILNGLQPGAEIYAAANGFVPVLNSLEQVAAWRRAAGALHRDLPALLQFDTGMSRLGLSPEETARLLAEPDLLSGLSIRYIMSHLACADDSESPENDAQFAVMRERIAQFPGIPLCFANSGGIFFDKSFHGALVRPGVAIYGVTPSDRAAGPMKPVVQLEAKVIQTRTVPAGTTVGYGASFIAPAEMELATIAVGYADGLPRCLSNRGAAYFGATRLPIVGRVSMDSVIIDVSALPQGMLTLGSLVEIIGPHQSLDDVAADAGTIAYEILTSLGHRYRRDYIKQ